MAEARISRSIEKNLKQVLAVVVIGAVAVVDAARDHRKQSIGSEEAPSYGPSLPKPPTPKHWRVKPVPKTPELTHGIFGFEGEGGWALNVPTQIALRLHNMAHQEGSSGLKRAEIDTLFDHTDPDKRQEALQRLVEKGFAALALAEGGEELYSPTAKLQKVIEKGEQPFDSPLYC